VGLKVGKQNLKILVNEGKNGKNLLVKSEVREKGGARRG